MSTTELLAQIRNQQTESLEDNVMVLGQLLHQRQSRRHGLVNAVGDSHHIQGMKANLKLSSS